MGSRKPRGLRVNKPELPEIYIPGNSVEYYEWRAGKMAKGVIDAPPIWSHDGYWIMDILVKDKEYQYNRVDNEVVRHYIIWHKKAQRWESGEI